MSFITKKITAASLLIAVLVQAHTIEKTGSLTDNPWVYNVPEAFDAIPIKTRTFCNVWTKDIITYPAYSQTKANRYQGIWTEFNRFHSIKRLPEHLGMGNYVICAGSNPQHHQAELFIAQLESEAGTGLFTKNTQHGIPSINDKLIKKVVLSPTHWRIGSFDMTGAYLIVPVDDGKGSRIQFYKIKQLDQPDGTKEITLHDLGISLERPGLDSVACTCTQLADGHYLVAVWTHGNDGKSKGLDFYFSDTCTMEDGFKSQPMMHIQTKFFHHYTSKNDFHNINFVHDDNGTLYLVALGTNNGAYAYTGTIDGASLFEIKILKPTREMIESARQHNPHGITAHLQEGHKRAYVNFIKEKHMYCKQGFCSFDSGATLYIPDQQHMIVYSMPHALIDHGHQLTFAQYGSMRKTYPQE